MKLRLFYLILICCSISAFSQNVRIEFIEKEGDQQFGYGQYLSAINMYKKVLEIDPNYVRAQYKLADCYRLIQDYESASYYYQSIALANDPRFPLAGFYYGVSHKIKAKYPEAIKTFQSFRQLLVKTNQHEKEDLRYFYKQAKIEIDGCQLALNQVTIVQPEYGFRLLPEPVNSEYNDYAATLYLNDSTLCLTSARKEGKGKLQDNQFGEGFADLFRFEKTKSGWRSVSTSDRFESNINTKWGDGSGSFNRARDRFYYTNCDSELGDNCHVFVSKLINGTWTTPVALNNNINERGFSSKHPNLTPTGDTLFYVSDKAGSFGGLDIWMSISSGNDNWGPSVNLGDQINTPFNEVSPFFDPNERVLFFASDGHRGFGGYDIYIARGASFRAAEIYNAGLPFNSNADDIFFFLGNNKGYLSSNREEGLGKFDIYGFAMKSKEEVVMEVSNESSVAGRNSLFTDDYNFDSPQAEIINQIISRRLSSEFSDVDLLLTEEQVQVYESLSQDDKDRIDKIVNARLRKMTNSMIRSVRSEDDFYYQQLSSERRRQVDNVVTSHIEQRGLGRSVEMNDRDEKFYSSMEQSEREKLEILITERVKNAEDYKAIPSRYQTYSPGDQKTIDDIVVRYIEQKKGWQTATLTVDQRDFWKKNSAEEPYKINTAIRERLLMLSGTGSFELSKEDKEFYDELSEENRRKLSAIAKTYLMADFQTFEELLKPEDIKLYQDFGEKSRKILDKLLVKSISNIAEADIYRVEALYQNWELKNSNKIDPDKTIAQLKQGRTDLTKEDQEALNRFVKTSYNSYLMNVGAIYMSVLPIVSVSGVSNSEATSNNELEDDALNKYSVLSSSRRKVIDKLIGLNYINKAYEDKNLETNDNGLYRTFMPYEKRHVEVLAKGVKGDEMQETEKEYLTDAYTYYNAQSKYRKGLLNRLVLSRAFDRVNGKFVLSPEDAKINGSLSPDELKLVADLQKFRMGNERFLTENLAVEAKDVNQTSYQTMALARKAGLAGSKGSIITQQKDIKTVEGRVILNLPSSDMKNYSQLFVSGQLIDGKTQRPLGQHPISLKEQSKDELVIFEFTDENGFFEFNTVAGDYHFVTDDVPNGGEIRIKDLKIEGYNERVKYVNESRVYFDTDSDQIRSEARQMLDDLIAACKGLPLKIEIESHTDNTGGEHYNKLLSRRRGQSIVDYLVKNGFKKSEVSLIWHGQEKPLATNNNPYGRQINRRVDVRIITTGVDKIETGDMYLARPGVSLDKIAASFGIDLNNMFEYNGTSNTNLRAYQPVRVKGSTKEPDLDLVAPTNITVVSEFVYTVKAGESIPDIAKKFNVPEEVIIEMNKITPSTLKPGMKLKVYPMKDN